MSHTPGPWWWNPKGGEVLAPVATGDVVGNGHLAVGYEGHVIAESVSRRNGQLLAAAPELLAVCKEFVAAFDPASNGFASADDAVRVIREVRAAVEKAEGWR